MYLLPKCRQCSAIVCNSCFTVCVNYFNENFSYPLKKKVSTVGILKLGNKKEIWLGK